MARLTLACFATCETVTKAKKKKKLKFLAVWHIFLKRKRMRGNRKGDIHWHRSSCTTLLLSVIRKKKNRSEEISGLFCLSIVGGEGKGGKGGVFVGVCLIYKCRRVLFKW